MGGYLAPSSGLIVRKDVGIPTVGHVLVPTIEMGTHLFRGSLSPR